MSSGFVSAGTNQEPVERDEEWLRVQHELEEERQRKAELGRQDGGKSLFEVLEQNKMAKQEAFEEKIKLKNQFRSLDEDEVDFLDSIMESTRAQEAAVKKETIEQLEVFRRQREEAEKALMEDNTADVVPAGEGEDWKIPARKRRRDKNKNLLIPGKKRKSMGDGAEEGAPAKELKSDKHANETERNNEGSRESSSSAPPPKPTIQGATNSTRLENEPPKEGEKADLKQSQAKQTSPPSTSLGLAGYSSDSE
ncbi:N-terminal domain of NEFA-interacting nuclear protein NIP30-domain-containing protein [Aspergillus taichungensis]|uniref:N-terminal domain of NEFA-interacting nuclear protein NIP30-domain-containing protein n=1 Tax=Aspergillus taichungensis TaxID=482145 RepID=A0A2J5HQN1_9EURO|nr:N-terminal domain of NEFA-interacting nuclear protein NIP30-domain-containing protein [Aspergillus taichungensis]